MQDQAKAFGEKLSVDGVEPAVTEVLDDDALRAVAPGRAVVTDKFADKHDLAEGDSLALTTPADKRLARARSAAISHPDKFNPLEMGEVTIARSDYDGAFLNDRERFAFINAGERVGPGAGAGAGAVRRCQAPDQGAVPEPTSRPGWTRSSRSSTSCSGWR